MVRAALRVDELIERTPAIVENSRSSGVATEDAIVSGFAPGWNGGHLDRRIVHARERGDRQSAESTTPNKRIANVTSVVITGRSIKIREKCMITSLVEIFAPGKSRD